MLKTLFREIVVFLACITVFPLVALAVLSIQYSLSVAFGLVLREAFFGLGYSEHGPASLLMRLLTPYALFQAIRAHGWSQMSLVGRRWAHAYYAALLLVTGTWFLSTAWDLFHFMYALGDIPAELTQFIELEGASTFIGIGSYIFCLYCVRIAVNPSIPNPEPREMRRS